MRASVHFKWTGWSPGLDWLATNTEIPDNFGAALSVERPTVVYGPIIPDSGDGQSTALLETSDFAVLLEDPTSGCEAVGFGRSWRRQAHSCD